MAGSKIYSFLSFSNFCFRISDYAALELADACFIQLAAD